MRLPNLLLMACVTVASQAFATPQARDATDMWFDPAESGWGLNVIHQGDTLFATLFVYGADGQPKWFVASSLAGGPGAYSGPLFECTGAWFGESFGARPVDCRQVGPMSLQLGDGSAVVDYTVDGVRVAKQVKRFTFRPTSLQGSYEAYIVQPGTNSTANKTDLTLQVTDDGSNVVMSSSSDSQGSCDWRGTRSQDGQVESVSGTFQCGSRSGTWSMSADPTTEGFTGTFSGDGISSGSIAAARRQGDLAMQGSGWRNDMWFVPSESGWGLNVIEQGDTLFATLFVYDSQHRPHWYVASNLAQQGDSADGRVTYSGTLDDCTGPYFAAAFNPAAVTCRPVGPMSFQASPDGSGLVAYTIDGVQVAKQVQRFAFRKQDFSGSYLGSYDHDRQAIMTINDSGPQFRMQLVDRFGGMGTCDFVAPYAQLGSLRVMNGTYSCGTRTGSFVMQQATVSANGFTARFDTPMFDFRAITNGHIAGVRR